MQAPGPTHCWFCWGAHRPGRPARFWARLQAHKCKIAPKCTSWGGMCAPQGPGPNHAAVLHLWCGAITVQNLVWATAHSPHTMPKPQCGAYCIKKLKHDGHSYSVAHSMNGSLLLCPSSLSTTSDTFQLNSLLVDSWPCVDGIATSGGCEAANRSYGVGCSAHDLLSHPQCVGREGQLVLTPPAWCESQAVAHPSPPSCGAAYRGAR